jgi:hypothetical protein
MTGEGNIHALIYVVGFFVGAVVFHLFVIDIIKALLGC